MNGVTASASSHLEQVRDRKDFSDDYKGVLMEVVRGHHGATISELETALAAMKAAGDCLAAKAALSSVYWRLRHKQRVGS